MFAKVSLVDPLEACLGSCLGVILLQQMLDNWT